MWLLTTNIHQFRQLRINYNLLLLNDKTDTGIQEHIIIVALSTESLKEFIINVYGSLFKDKHNLVNFYLKTLIMIHALPFHKWKSNATQLAHLREANTHFQLIAASPTKCPSSGLYKTHHSHHQRWALFSSFQYIWFQTNISIHGRDSWSITS